MVRWIDFATLHSRFDGVYSIYPVCLVPISFHLERPLLQQLGASPQGDAWRSQAGRWPGVGRAPLAGRRGEKVDSLGLFGVP